MDFLEILLIFIFFVLPLLQQLRGKGDPRADPVPHREGDEELEEDFDWEEDVRRERVEESALDLPAWIKPLPREEAPVLTAPAEEPPLEAIVLEAPVREEPVRPHRELPLKTEVELVDLPVVSMEALQVDRESEHRRFHDRVTAAAVTRPSAPARPSIARSLRDPEGLRRAILLTEVLGPPRALRPPE